MGKTARDTLASLVADLDLLYDIEREIPTTVGEGPLEAVKRIAADRRALVRLLHELQVKPDRLWSGYYEDTQFQGWACKPVQALRKHLGLGEDPGDEYRNERWSDKEERLKREAHEKSSEHAIKMAEAWMAEAERRKAKGL
jgi:hypothetical protein